MKKFIFLVTLLVLSEGLTAQFSRQPNPQIIDVKPFSEQFGLVKIRTKEESDAKWHFWHLQDTIYQKESYNNAMPYSEGFAAVKLKGNKSKGSKAKVAWQFINKKGELQQNQYEDVRSFKNGFAAVKKGDLWGFIDTFFNQVIDCQYLEAFDFSEERCKVILQHPISGNFNHLMINKKGKVIGKFDSLGNVSDGLALIANRNGDGDIRYVDTNGIAIKKMNENGKLQYGGTFSEGYAAVAYKKAANTLKYVDIEGNLLDISIEGGLSEKKEERSLHDFKEKRAAFKQGTQWIFIDEEGHKLYPKSKFKSVTSFSDGFAAVEGENGWFFIDAAKGDTAFNRVFKNAKPFSDKVAWVETEDGWGLITIAQPPVIAMPWNDGVNQGNPAHEPKNALNCMTVIQSKIEFKTTIQSSTPLNQVALIINGQTPIAIEPVRTNQGYTIAYSIDLQADNNEIRIKAENIGGIAEKAICIHYNNRINYKALLFANNDYKFCPYHSTKVRCMDADHWCDLDKPIQDAEGLENILKAQYQFSTIKVVRNATKHQMLAAFEQLAQSNQPDDNILIFYAGHGDYKDGCPYFIPTDAVNEQRETYFSMEEFEQAIAKIECADQILTIIDACYGGSFTTKGSCSHVKSEESSIERGSTTQLKKIRQTGCKQSKERARYIITSGHKTPVDDKSQFMIGLCYYLNENQAVELTHGLLYESVTSWLDKQPNREKAQAQVGRLNGNSIPDGSGRFKFRKKI